MIRIPRFELFVVVALVSMSANAAIVSVKAGEGTSDDAALAPELLPAFEHVWKHRQRVAEYVDEPAWDYVLLVRDTDVGDHRVRWVYSRRTGLLRPLSTSIVGIWSVLPAHRSFFHRVLGVAATETWKAPGKTPASAAVDGKPLEGRALAGLGVIWDNLLRTAEVVRDAGMVKAIDVDGQRWAYDARGIVRLHSKSATTTYLVLPGVFRRFSALLGVDTCPIDTELERLLPAAE